MTLIHNGDGYLTKQYLRSNIYGPCIKYTYTVSHFLANKNSVHPISNSANSLESPPSQYLLCLCGTFLATSAPYPSHPPNTGCTK
jgi:hypothetical protein